EDRAAHVAEPNAAKVRGGCAGRLGIEDRPNVLAEGRPKVPFHFQYEETQRLPVDAQRLEDRRVVDASSPRRHSDQNVAGSQQRGTADRGTLSTKHRPKANVVSIAQTQYLRLQFHGPAVLGVYLAAHPERSRRAHA